MSGDTSSSIYLDMMHSLYEAFLARQGTGGRCPPGWGRQFFDLLDEGHPEWCAKQLSIYLTAQNLLYRFAVRNQSEELGMMIFNNPASLLRTAILVLKHDRCGLVSIQGLALQASIN